MTNTGRTQRLIDRPVARVLKQRFAKYVISPIITYTKRVYNRSRIPAACQRLFLVRLFTQTFYLVKIYIALINIDLAMRLLNHSINISSVD